MVGCEHVCHRETESVGQRFNVRRDFDRRFVGIPNARGTDIDKGRLFIHQQQVLPNSSAATFEGIHHHFAVHVATRSPLDAQRRIGIIVRHIHRVVVVVLVEGDADKLVLIMLFHVFHADPSTRTPTAASACKFLDNRATGRIAQNIDKFGRNRGRFVIVLTVHLVERHFDGIIFVVRRAGALHFGDSALIQSGWNRGFERELLLFLFAVDFDGVINGINGIFTITIDRKTSLERFVGRQYQGFQIPEFHVVFRQIQVGDGQLQW